MQGHQERTKAIESSRTGRRRTGWLRRLATDVFFVARRDRTWWMLPLVLMLLLVAGLLAFVTLAGPLAPFIYPLL
jgi:hypothetical protein